MPARETKRIVIFTLPPVREIDSVGAADVFTSANRAAAGEPLYEITIVSAEKIAILIFRNFGARLTHYWSQAELALKKGSRTALQ
jgi:hypothetical protein